MDRKQILQNIRDAKQMLVEARRAFDRGDDAYMLRRLSLAAQYSSLAAHYMPENQPGVPEMKATWEAANNVWRASFAANRPE
jgi:hypothetical protein